MPEFLPTITLWQPWATLVAEGLKPFEFRRWPAPARLVGKRIAIHAGARPVRLAELLELEAMMSSENWRTTGLIEPGKVLDLLDAASRHGASLPLSSVLCIATLGRPIRNEELATRIGVTWTNDSGRDEHSNWGWPLADIERLQPFVPAKGAQGFWQWARSDA